MTTKTCGAGGDYTDLADWEANELGTLTFEEDMIAQIIGELPDDPVTYSGFNPAGFDTIIEAVAGEGMPSFTASDPLDYTTAKGGASRNTTSAVLITVDFDGLGGKLIYRDVQLYQNNNNGFLFTIPNGRDDIPLEVTNCIWKGGQQNTDMIRISTAANDYKFTNCLMLVPAGNREVMRGGSGAGSRWFNCRFVCLNATRSTVEALRLSGGSIHYAQCQFLNWPNAHAIDSGTPPVTGDFNTLDNIGGTLQGLNSDDTIIAADEVENVLTDFRLKTGATGIDFGGTDPDTPSDDIIGQIRTGTNDNGCWTVVVAPTGGLSVNLTASGGLVARGGLVGIGGGLVR